MTVAFFMVLLGEMGDKTQLLAMAFAGKYRAGQVMMGVLLATLLNHALAVAAGTYLANVIPMSVVSIVAGLSFLGFGLWTLHGETLGDEADRLSRFGPIMTVAFAFFLAEMGDKTQLATVALAAEYRSPLPILTGTTAGMLAADGLGVWVGALVSNRLSPKTMKLSSAGIFVVFGLITVFRAMAAGPIRMIAVGLLVFVTSGIGYWLLRPGKAVSEAEEDHHVA